MVKSQIQVKKGEHYNVVSYYFKLLCHTNNCHTFVPTFLPFMPITLVKP